jgi:hypothetical protein
MNISSQCSEPDCKRPAATSIELRSVCLPHFIMACEARLEELSKNALLWSLNQIAREKASRFTLECREKAAEICLRATQLGRQLWHNQ